MSGLTLGPVEFRILGPVEVLHDGQTIAPGSPKQRALLVNLIVHHGKVVSRDRLIEDLWAGSPPSTGLGVLQNYISQLRKVLGATVVVTRGTGYLLDVDPDSIDSVRFERLVEQGRTALQAGDPSHAGQVVGEALGLWRGPALADIATEAFAQAEISRLHELRAVAVELGLEAQIARGQHREAVGAGEAAVAEHPFRERLWWLLMLALYRSGRQADALRAYQRARTALRDELGLEPGSELRDLEAAILEQRRDLDELLVPTTPRRRVARHPRPATSLLGRAEEWSAIEAFPTAPPTPRVSCCSSSASRASARPASSRKPSGMWKDAAGSSSPGEASRPSAVGPTRVGRRLAQRAAARAGQEPADRVGAPPA
jgi:DNA-binding SARP family transcriptional activator